GAPLAGTAMTLLMASGALGDQRVGVLLPAPAAEALGPERAGVLPQARIVAGAGQVQDHAVIRAEMMPAPVERLADPSGHRGEERIVPAHLLDEGFQVALLAGTEGAAPPRMLDQGHGRELDEQRDRHDRTEDVQDLHRGDLLREPAA